MIRVIRHKLEEEIVFAIATVLAIGTSFMVKPSLALITVVPITMVKIIIIYRREIKAITVKLNFSLQ